MSLGRAYVWERDPKIELGGRVDTSIVPLLRLDSDSEGHNRLCGRYVRVRNGGVLRVLDTTTNTIKVMPIGDAQPDEANNYMFDPGQGGGRVDKLEYAGPLRSWRYTHASHFGEVNTYFHLDMMAAYIDDLIHTLDSQPLPKVIAVVNAHHAATGAGDELGGVRDGLLRGERWLPFQGGHYRLPSHHYDIEEYNPISAEGEIHLGPGWQLLDCGALVEAAVSKYRANASHNAGILYHEYGHHITRHTADLMANRFRAPDRQKNTKSAMDEGFCDYWAATMLGTPHIWAWHRRHDDQEIHPRSLTSAVTMAHFDPAPGADPHTNGTIWAAAWWDLRTHLHKTETNPVRVADRLALKTLILLGQMLDHVQPAAARELTRMRKSFGIGLAALLRADELLQAGAHRDVIATTFAARGIQPETGDEINTLAQFAAV